MTQLHKSNIEAIQYLRGLAALMVVIFHASREVRETFGFSTFAWGEFGVDIFFVISGFVMIYAITRAKSAVTSTNFMRYRILRIVPMYWLSTAVMAAAVLFKPDSFKSAELTAGHVVQSLFFIPHFHPKIEGAVLPLLVPGWTLNYEMYFYLVLSVCVASRGIKRLSLIAFILTIGFVVGQVLKESGALFVFLSNPIIFEFVFGMIICEAYLKGFTLPAKLAGPLFIAALLAILFTSQLEFRLASAGVYSALLVYSAISFDIKITSKMRLVLKVLGDSSYSLYLSHIFVIGFVGFAWGKVLSSPVSSNYFTASIYMILCSTFSCLCGYIIFNVVERRIIKFFKNRTSNPPLLATVESDAVETQ